MPLQPSLLQETLRSTFSKTRQTAADAARQIAQGYTDYAQAGMAGPASPILLLASTAALQATLLQALSNARSATASQFVQALSAGVLTFWTSPPVAFAGPGATGIATSIPGSSTIPAALLPTLSNPRSSLDQTAAQMASALHTATLTLIVLVAIPPAPPVPMPFV